MYHYCHGLLASVYKGFLNLSSKVHYHSTRNLKSTDVSVRAQRLVSSLLELRVHLFGIKFTRYKAIYSIL